MLWQLWCLVAWLIGVAASTGGNESSVDAASPFGMGAAAAARRAAHERSRKRSKRRKPAHEAEWRQLEASELVIHPR